MKILIVTPVWQVNEKGVKSHQSYIEAAATMAWWGCRYEKYEIIGAIGSYSHFVYRILTA